MVYVPGIIDTVLARSRERQHRRRFTASIRGGWSRTAFEAALLLTHRWTGLDATVELPDP